MSVVSALEEINGISDDESLGDSNNKPDAIRKVLDDAVNEYPLMAQASRGEVDLPEIVTRIMEQYKECIAEIRDSDDDRKCDRLQLDEIGINTYVFKTRWYLPPGSHPRISEVYNWCMERCYKAIVPVLLFTGLGAIMEYYAIQADPDFKQGTAILLGSFAGLMAGIVKSIESIRYRRQERDKVDLLQSEINQTYNLATPRPT